MTKIKFWAVIALFLTALSGFVTAASADSSAVVGTWRIDSGKVTIRIAPCGSALCGTVVALKKPLDKNGRPKVDKKNPNPALRNRPSIGLTILTDMRPTGNDNEWQGTIYNADDGRTYKGYMQLSGDNIEVKGCVGPFCKGKNFERVK